MHSSYMNKSPLLRYWNGVQISMLYYTYIKPVGSLDMSWWGGGGGKYLQLYAAPVSTPFLESAVITCHGWHEFQLICLAYDPFKGVLICHLFLVKLIFFPL